jgi:predicted ester cyclase
MMFPLRTFRLALLALLAVALTMPVNPLGSLAQDATAEPECVETTPEENAALVAMYWQEAVWGAQGTIDEIVAEDEVHHWGIAGDTHGLAAFAERWALFNAAFPDLEFIVGPIVAEGDLAASQWTATGTHRGEWQGIAPTDKEVSWSGINLFRFECGLIAESWGEADHVGLRAQLGATDVPAWLATPAAAAMAMTAPAATPCADDSAEANIELARRWSEEVWTGQDLEVISEILAPSAVQHGAAFHDVQGPEAVAEAVGRQLESFPDIEITVEEAIASDNLVAVRWTGTGTQEGEYLGLAPTGQVADMTGINIYRISCGQVVESWSEMNLIQILQELREGTGEATPAA